MPDGGLRDRLEEVGADLAAQLDVVREVCRRAQSEAPSASFEVPGAGGRGPDLHRRLSRAANLVAQAAQSAAMARAAERAGRHVEAGEGAVAARRAAAEARSLLSD